MSPTCYWNDHMIAIVCVCAALCCSSERPRHASNTFTAAGERAAPARRVRQCYSSPTGRCRPLIGMEPSQPQRLVED